MHTNFIYVFITITGYTPLLVEYESPRTSPASMDCFGPDIASDIYILLKFTVPK